MSNSLTGADTLVLAGRVFADFADGDNFAVTYAADIAGVKRGKDGNTIYAQNATGPQATMTLRLIRGSDDDRFLNALLFVQQDDFASFVLLEGQYVKRVGDGLGNITHDTGNLFGGVFKKIPEAKSNVEGDTEQSITLYTLEFSSAERNIF